MLRGLEHTLDRAADSTVATLTGDDEPPNGRVVTVAGILIGVQRRVTKAGKVWVSATLEDLTGGVETLFFPATFDLVGQHLAEDAIVVVKGRVSRSDDALAVIAVDVAVPDLTAGPPQVTVTIRRRGVPASWSTRSRTRCGHAPAGPRSGCG